MKSKKLFITGIVIFSAVVVLATFLLLWYWGDTYPQFDGTELRSKLNFTVFVRLCNDFTSYFIVKRLVRRLCAINVTLVAFVPPPIWRTKAT